MTETLPIFNSFERVGSNLGGGGGGTISFRILVSLPKNLKKTNAIRPQVH
jgi:hypothetical protein